MIYVMGTGSSTIVKIGTAINPGQRLKQIQAGHPEPLSLLYAAPGDHTTESYLHRHFSARRVSAREWFDFSDSDAVAEVRDALAPSVVEKAETSPHVFTRLVPVNRTPPGHRPATPVLMLDIDGSPLTIDGPDEHGAYALHIGYEAQSYRGDADAIDYLRTAHLEDFSELALLRDLLSEEIERVEKLHAETGGEFYRREADGSRSLLGPDGRAASGGLSS